MKPAIAIMMLATIFGAGTASAKQVPMFIDADNRVASGMSPAGHALDTTEAMPVIAAVIAAPPADSELNTPPVTARMAPAQLAANIAPVPEPSSIVMLIGGLLLLLAASSGGRSAVFQYTNKRLPARPFKNSNL